MNTVLGMELKSPMLEGMPAKWLDCALLWLPSTKARRRLGVSSWSWLGWTEKPNWCFTSMDIGTNITARWLGTCTFISWHQSDGRGPPSLLHNNDEPAYAWIQAEFSHFEGAPSLPPRILRFHTGEFDSVDLLGRPLLRKKALYELLPPQLSLQLDNVKPAPVSSPVRSYLHFWTFIIHFSLGSTDLRLVQTRMPLPDDEYQYVAEECKRMEDYVSTRSGFHLGIYDTNHRLCGLMFLPEMCAATFSGKICEFLILSEEDSFSWYNNYQKYLETEPHPHRTFMPHVPQWDKPFKMWNVLLIERHDGFSERVGAGRICRGAMDNSCPPGPVWQEITLG